MALEARPVTAARPMGFGGMSAGVSLPGSIVGSTGLTAAQIASRNASQAASDALLKKQQDEIAAQEAARQQQEMMPGSMRAIVPTYDQSVAREDQVTQRSQSREDSQHNLARSEGLEDENRIWSRIQPYIDTITKPVNFSSSVSAGSGSGSGAALPGSAATANDLAFARAKDKAGLLANARMRDIGDQAVTRGFAGSGDDQKKYAGVISDTGDYLTDVATAEAQDESNRAYSLDDRNFNAALQVRQNNMAMLPSLLALLRRY